MWCEERELEMKKIFILVTSFVFKIEFQNASFELYQIIKKVLIRINNSINLMHQIN